jgi:Asp-tRNA(Asn)/Glu-tRNA(Gln) amidotransferase A subunit family amidase
MTRRELLTAASAFVAAGMIPRAFSENTSDLDFRSALDVAARIKAKQVSSTELTTRMLARIDRYNPKINAFTYQMRDQALAQARRADAAVSRSDQVGPFHGVPICVKEAFGVKGEPDTWGIVALKGSKAPANSAAVERLLDSGAVLLGGTNVPLNLMDWQSFNDIYGTTNNPWDLTRTPGGSSGGSAAALAAGLSYLSIGSDIGGSLRVPASFCGVFSHKPTLDLVSSSGMVPGGAPGLPGFSTGLAVAGPMARSARDLMTSLRVLGGPVGYERKAWSWTLPPPPEACFKGVSGWVRTRQSNGKPDFRSPAAAARNAQRARARSSTTAARLAAGLRPARSLQQLYFSPLCFRLQHRGQAGGGDRPRKVPAESTKSLCCRFAQFVR